MALFFYITLGSAAALYVVDAGGYRRAVYGRRTASARTEAESQKLLIVARGAER